MKKASAGNPASEKQLGFLSKLGKENAITDLLQYAGSIIGREIDALTKMNAQEASQVIDRLMNPVPPKDEMFENPFDGEEPF